MAPTSPGRIVGVTRVFNEEGIIEPFVRHHAPLLDQHLFLDNGSTDRTLDILRALQADGFRLHAWQTESPIFVEPTYNTGLYALAVETGADWVAFLDCDEFLDARRLPDGVHSFLAAIPPEARCVQVPVVNYVAATPETQDELNPAKRLVVRERTSQGSKVIIRAMEPGRVTVDAGNHGIRADGVPDLGLPQTSLVLAHFPHRSPWQAAAKTVVHRLKTLARGRAEANLNWNNHYIPAFEALKRQPRAWLAQAGEPPRDRDLLHDPIAYQGGGLVHTSWPDDEARLISILAAYAETLARSHGDILDRKRLIRGGLLQQAAQARRLF